MLALFDGKGIIAEQESALMLQASLLMLIVAVAVFTLLFYFARHYRASNTKAVYMPNWEHSKMDELVWWAIPFEIVLVLAALTYSSTHALDPRKPIISATPPLTIQVVALPWKWLFIYPELEVATVNLMPIPAHTPINLEVTADAPMNSFWVPHLGGQIYAMSGMVNTLHLMADETGEFPGLSANYSGEGFSGMRFTVRSITQDEFAAWVSTTKHAPLTLDTATYDTLAKPSSNEPSHIFGAVEPSLFHAIVTGN